MLNTILKYNFVYIITNIINNKQYIGDHSTNNFNDNYLGGGLSLIKAKKKYGKQNFKKEILEFFPTKQDAFDAQEKYINEYNTLTPNGYNISPKGGNRVRGCHSEETKYKIGKGCRGIKNEIISRYNTQNKKGKSIEHQMINIYGKDEGLKRAKEYKKKISIKTSKENNGMYNKGYLISNEKNGMYGKISPLKGKKCTLEHNRKISESKRGIKRKKNLCIYCNREIADGNYQRWHNEKCKQKNK